MVLQGEGGNCSPFPALHSACFAASCSLMALTSWNTRGEMPGILCPHRKKMGGMRVDGAPAPAFSLPQLPRGPHPSFFPSQFCLH